MESSKKIVYNRHQLDQAVDLLMPLFATYQIFTFTGTLGAGKTTLIQQLLRRKGVTQEVLTSPTFTYVNIYTNQAQQTFYHFDCYRMADLNAFLQAGFGEYLYQPNSWVFIEWPEVIEPLLQHKVCAINLEYVDSDHRRLTYTLRG